MKAVTALLSTWRISSWTSFYEWQGAASSNTGTCGSTYAEHAKKNMIGRGASQQAQTQARTYEQQQWGQIKVDQQTPWDTGTLAGFNAVHVAANDPKTVAAADWGPAGATAAAAPARWGPPAAVQWPMHPVAAAAAPSTANPEWAVAAAAAAAAAAAHHRHDAAAAMIPWNGGAAAPHAPLLSQPAGAWGQVPGVVQHPVPAALPNPNEQYDPNPQTPGPWIAPQPQEMNNDMMWHDPNPKQKKVQRDTGTAIWGDPQQQPVEIKRWKDAEVVDYSHVQSAIPCGGDWSSIPVSVNGTIATGTASNSSTGTLTNSCCPNTGANVSTPTTAGGCAGSNGPWPEGALLLQSLLSLKC
ncbi:unnamed protein product [Gongylonema pulchrum]|uniref:M_domain domain-containing protein n=1 Tax=Gongylonema pulchrum TaxID=637853 RepID=A0A183EE69_9BILA|nr:unnamed protein product [Gongylonema pulchrum]